MPKGSGPQVGRVSPHRWGKPVNGRWSAGWQAPGGWSGYRRLHRGNALPSYWTGSGFRVPDYLSFGLAAPPQGYSWVRYYDDAVLVDGRGQVWDSRDGIAWSDGSSYSESYAYAASYADAGASYAAPQIQPVEPYDDYDIPVAPDVPPPPPGAGYDAPIPAPYGAYPPAPPIHVQPYSAPVQVRTYGAPPCAQVCGGAYQGGAFYGGSAYASGYYASGASTTIVINPAPIVTTTTTVVEERIIADSVAVAPKRVLRKKLLRRAPRCGC
nr:RcnB family protein [Sphingomonas xinjiangensis]